MMFRLIGASVFLGVVLAVLTLAASAAVLPRDAPDYNWAQREPSTAPYEACEPATAVVAEATAPAVREAVLPPDAWDYNWAQREPSTAPYEPTEPPAHH